MARSAKKVRDLPGQAQKITSRRTQRQARRAAEAPLGKTFDELNEAEKDDLLKRLAILAGLVEE